MPLSLTASQCAKLEMLQFKRMEGGIIGVDLAKNVFLLLGCLGLDKAHGRAQRRLDNRLSISTVVLVPLDKSLDGPRRPVSHALVLSRICAAPSPRLGHLTFEGQGAFASQC